LCCRSLQVCEPGALFGRGQLEQGRGITVSPIEALLRDVVEEGEEMDATNEDDSEMMALMGMSGFGTTKV